VGLCRGLRQRFGSTLDRFGLWQHQRGVHDIFATPLQLLDLSYPVDEFVLAVHQETGPSDIMSNAVSKRKHSNKTRLPNMRRSQVYLAVHRYENSVYYRRIDHEAFLLLSALQKGTPLGIALEAAFAESILPAEDQAAKIQECFAHAAKLGWFCRQLTERTTENRDGSLDRVHQAESLQRMLVGM